MSKHTKGPIGWVRIFRAPSRYMGHVDIGVIDVDGRAHRLTAPCTDALFARLLECWAADEAFDAESVLPGAAQTGLWQMCARPERRSA